MELRTVVLTVLGISLCFLVIPIRVGPSSTVQDVKLFEAYVSRYNKSYRHDPTEYDKRFERFQRSLRHIERMNKLRNSEDSAIYGTTEFSDLSEEEFLSLTLRPDLSTRGQRHLNDTHHRDHRSHGDRNRLKSRLKRAVGIPPKFDWRTKGAVTPIRSQGSCGACWAYSSVECVESMVAIKNGTLKSFSVQQMIDCAGNGNFGCEGGDICSLLTWLVNKKISILPEKEYPITGQSAACKLDKTKTSNLHVSDFTCDSFVGAEDELLASLANHGPVAAAVNALSWQNYLGGIIQFHCDGAFESLNHAVQIVGYDKTAAIPYYIVRNSWGTLFGNKGYLYIAIGSNMCGIANQVSSVDVDYK